MNYLKIRILLVLLSILTVFTIYAQDKNFDDWHISKELTVIESISDYCSYKIDDDVYKYSSADFSDIRILDENGAEVPYFIASKESVKVKIKKQYDAYRIKTGKYKEAEYYFTDWQIVNPGKNFKFNRIIFNLYANKYSTQINIYGRNDKSDWQYITRDTVYKVGSNIKNYILLNSASDFTYLRFASSDSNFKNSITLKGIVYDVSDVKENAYKSIIDADYSIENKSSTTIINVNNENRRQIEEVVVEASGNYYRQIFLKEKNNDTVLTSGAIKSVSFDNIQVMENILHIPGFTTSPLKLEIENKNDSPLNIKKVKLKIRENNLIFKKHNSSKYKIIFSNKNVKTPQYDIIRFKDHIMEGPLNRTKSGSLEGSVPEVKEADPNRFKNIFNIAIVLVSIVLIVLVALKLKPGK